jgi:hypothetical protein
MKLYERCDMCKKNIFFEKLEYPEITLPTGHKATLKTKRVCKKCSKKIKSQLNAR